VPRAKARRDDEGKINPDRENPAGVGIAGEIDSAEIK